jgi:hypothetical protein
VTSCIVDNAAIYIMVVKCRNTICPPPPQVSLYRRAALSSNSNGTRSEYSRKNPKSSLYWRCLCTDRLNSLTTSAIFCGRTSNCTVYICNWDLTGNYSQRSTAYSTVLYMSVRSTHTQSKHMKMLLLRLH